MTTFPPAGTDDPDTFQAPHFRELRRTLSPSRAYRPDEVAALPTERILSMSRSELIDVIRSVRGRHLRPGILERLPQMDGETLRKLVFLTRRYCRNQQLLAQTEPSPNVVAAYCR